VDRHSLRGCAARRISPAGKRCHEEAMSARLLPAGQRIHRRSQRTQRQILNRSKRGQRRESQIIGLVDFSEVKTFVSFVTFCKKSSVLKLLRHMNTRRYQADIEIMDPKRPYGDKDYQRLHGEMLWAVTAFLR
jgi:hypothetical protein